MEQSKNWKRFEEEQKVKEEKQGKKRQKLIAEQIERNKVVDSLLKPEIKNRAIDWKSDSFIIFDGYYNKKKIFTIKKGFISFCMQVFEPSLKAINNKKFYSPDLITLQEKAEKLLKEFKKLNILSVLKKS